MATTLAVPLDNAHVRTTVENLSLEVTSSACNVLEHVHILAIYWNGDHCSPLESGIQVRIHQNNSRDINANKYIT